MVHRMGFGSYDESEQGNRDFDADGADDDASVTTEEHAHEGDVEYDIGASNDELLDKLQDIKDE